MLVMKDKEAPTPPKVRQMISREMRAGIADRSGGGPHGDAQAGQERGGSLWRVSGRGG